MMQYRVSRRISRLRHLCLRCVSSESEQVAQLLHNLPSAYLKDAARALIHVERSEFSDLPASASDNVQRAVAKIHEIGSVFRFRGYKGKTVKAARMARLCTDWKSSEHVHILGVSDEELEEQTVESQHKNLVSIVQSNCSLFPMTVKEMTETPSLYELPPLYTLTAEQLDALQQMYLHMESAEYALNRFYKNATDATDASTCGEDIFLTENRTQRLTVVAQLLEMYALLQNVVTPPVTLIQHVLRELKFDRVSAQVLDVSLALLARAEAMSQMPPPEALYSHQDSELQALLPRKGTLTLHALPLSREQLHQVQQDLWDDPLTQELLSAIPCDRALTARIRTKLMSLKSGSSNARRKALGEAYAEIPKVSRHTVGVMTALDSLAAIEAQMHGFCLGDPVKRWAICREVARKLQRVRASARIAGVASDDPDSDITGDLPGVVSNSIVSRNIVLKRTLPDMLVEAVSLHERPRGRMPRARPSIESDRAEGEFVRQVRQVTEQLVSRIVLLPMQTVLAGSSQIHEQSVQRRVQQQLDEMKAVTPAETRATKAAQANTLVLHFMQRGDLEGALHALEVSRRMRCFQRPIVTKEQVYLNLSGMRPAVIPLALHDLLTRTLRELTTMPEQVSVAVPPQQTRLAALTRNCVVRVIRPTPQSETHLEEGAVVFFGPALEAWLLAHNQAPDVFAETTAHGAPAAEAIVSALSELKYVKESYARELLQQVIANKSGQSSTSVSAATTPQKLAEAPSTPMPTLADPVGRVFLNSENDDGSDAPTASAEHSDANTVDWFESLSANFVQQKTTQEQQSQSQVFLLTSELELCPHVCAFSRTRKICRN
ncbi:MAG: hypothetical protein MHM6MM_000550 [Cercozoa sp. M6MM]